MNETTTSSSSSTERIIRWSTVAAVLCVATVAAVVSYDHAHALVREYGEDGWTARLVPLTVDGLIYASSMVLLHSARRRTPVPRFARWLLGLGIAATLAANAAHGLDRGPVGALIAAWPAVALVGTYELLMMIIRSTGQAVAVLARDAAVPMAPVATSDDPTVPADGSMAVHGGDPLETRAAEMFSEELASGHMPTIRAIRSRLRIGQPKAQQVRAYLSTLVVAQGGGQA